jgi:hypothetical protein
MFYSFPKVWNVKTRKLEKKDLPGHADEVNINS